MLVYSNNVFVYNTGRDAFGSLGQLLLLQDLFQKSIYNIFQTADFTQYILENFIIYHYGGGKERRIEMCMYCLF